jgi:hypothetical protein
MLTLTILVLDASEAAVAAHVTSLICVLLWDCIFSVRRSCERDVVIPNVASLVFVLLWGCYLLSSKKS